MEVAAEEVVAGVMFLVEEVDKSEVMATGEASSVTAPPGLCLVKRMPTR